MDKQRYVIDLLTVQDKPLLGSDNLVNKMIMEDLTALYLHYTLCSMSPNLLLHFNIYMFCCEVYGTDGF